MSNPVGFNFSSSLNRAIDWLYETLTSEGKKEKELRDTCMNVGLTMCTQGDSDDIAESNKDKLKPVVREDCDSFEIAKTSDQLARRNQMFTNAKKHFGGEGVCLQLRQEVGIKDEVNVKNKSKFEALEIIPLLAVAALTLRSLSKNTATNRSPILLGAAFVFSMGIAISSNVDWDQIF
jgi:hypothetical protein